MGPPELRPAWYALRPGGARDWVTLLHPPYTAWHLAYVLAGAALAPSFQLDRALAALAAFFLALGIAAHALDELHGRPLRTEIPSTALVAAAVASLTGAAAIGIAAAFAWGFGLLVFIAVGAFLVPAYNLELFGGRLHTPLGFALAWGAFPALTGYYVEAQRVGVAGLAAGAGATGLSLLQRRLSTTARTARRERGALGDALAAERALRLATGLTIAVAVVLAAARLR